MSGSSSAGSVPAWRDRPDHRDWLAQQLRRQLAFASAFPHPDGGAGWLDGDGDLDLSRPVHTYVTARMAHVFCLGSLAGIPGCGPLADRALEALGGSGRLRDAEHGGWFASAGPGEETDESKQGYTHAFVLLAASSALVAGRPGAADLLEAAAQVLDERFLTDQGLYADLWDRSWTTLDPYRGVNANMHAVEACLAASDATGDRRFLDRALVITTRVVHEWARAQQWRVPEHFDADWTPLPEHHRDHPDHPFQPFGATVGHGLEWSRLVVQLHAALGEGRSGDEGAPDWMVPAARSLFDRAVTDGWSTDGAEGFVYTTDWEGVPVVRDRMHWVLAEGLCAAAALHDATGEESYDRLYRTWWDHAATSWVDPDDGSWQHQLTPDLAPTDSVWAGRPDTYHSLHAVLLPRLPQAPGAARALEAGLVDAGNRAPGGGVLR
ncbi:MAG: N-acyl-D-glucosamine 2-epimerase [Marmoricola sp.]|nr:N-acyl-D-glucosamine 2-epimerase [Marmoricola sp.]